jgi:hypothetical protein
MRSPKDILLSVVITAIFYASRRNIGSYTSKKEFGRGLMIYFVRQCFIRFINSVSLSYGITKRYLARVMAT